MSDVKQNWMQALIALAKVVVVQGSMDRSFQLIVFPRAGTVSESTFDKSIVSYIRIAWKGFESSQGQMEFLDAHQVARGRNPASCCCSATMERSISTTSMKYVRICINHICVRNMRFRTHIPRNLILELVHTMTVVLRIAMDHNRNPFMVR